jgi:hypothetical protein
MALIKINDNPSIRELRQFAGIWFPVFWMIVAGILYFGADSPTLAGVAAIFGILVGGVGIYRPAFIHPIYLGWMYAAYPVGWAMSHILLGIVFYVILTPIGLVMKLCRYDPMRRSIRTGEITYWGRYEPPANKNQYFRQF